jgi:hypothetical protein
MSNVGNAADPFETLGIWSDATRWYMISNTGIILV